MGRKWTKIELELYRRVDEVLYYVWAPIGVAHSSAARDAASRTNVVAASAGILHKPTSPLFMFFSEQTGHR